MTEYNKLVDHLVSTMPSNSVKQTNNEVHANSPYNDGWTQQHYQEQSNKQERKSFDELYEEYSSKSIPDQINNLKELGRDLFNKLDAIIDNLDVILEGADDDKSNK